MQDSRRSRRGHSPGSSSLFMLLVVLWWTLEILGMLALIFAGGCGAPSPSPAGRTPTSSEPSQARAPTGTIRIAWTVEPSTLSPKFTVGQAINDFVWVFNSSLTYYDLGGTPHTMLAREIPSRDAGDWVINADGTMATTYRLKPGARWHDGRPLTAQDFVFGFEIHTDRELPVIQREPEHLMSRVEAIDDLTFVVQWPQPYIRANLLGYREMVPIPRHLLEEKYRSNKAAFAIAEDWTTAYVGTGPFRLDRWTPGSGLIARAYTDWVLGPPKVETLDIRFMPDSNTILANLLSGEIDLASSPGVRAQEAAVARDSWVARGEGYLKTFETRVTYAEFQYRDVPGWQRAIADVRLRQALIHAIDRVALAEVVTLGLSPVADAFIVRTDPLFPEVDRSIVKYPYDVNRALALFAEAGWRASQPGALLTNPAGQTFEIEATTTVDRRDDATIVAGDWKTAGLDSRLNIIPPARERDREYRASFPAAYFGVRTVSLDNFYWVAGHIPTPQTGWVELNRGSFYDPEVDRLQNLTQTSFDEGVRRDAALGLHRRMAEIAGFGMLHYAVEAIVAKNKIKGPVGNYGPQLGITWNVHEWEVVP